MNSGPAAAHWSRYTEKMKYVETIVFDLDSLILTVTLYFLKHLSLLLWWAVSSTTSFSLTVSDYSCKSPQPPSRQAFSLRAEEALRGRREGGRGAQRSCTLQKTSKNQDWRLGDSGWLRREDEMKGLLKGWGEENRGMDCWKSGLELDRSEMRNIRQKIGWEKGGRRVTVRVRKAEGGRQLDEQERVRMRLSVSEGRRKGHALCFPTLCRFPQRTWLIPVLIGGEFQRTCSPGMSVERRESFWHIRRATAAGLMHNVREHFVRI